MEQHMKKPFSQIKNEHLRHALIFLLISLFLVVFASVYEMFSFGVYSVFMIFAFTVPLCLGTMISLVLFAVRAHATSPAAAAVYNSGIATLTVGSILKGVLDISGYTNHLMPVYAVSGAVLILTGAVLYFAKTGHDASIS
jgi:hypothetical protein